MGYRAYANRVSCCPATTGTPGDSGLSELPHPPNSPKSGMRSHEAGDAGRRAEDNLEPAAGRDAPAIRKNDKRVMNVASSISSRIFRPDRDAVTGSRHRQGSGEADLGLSEKRTGWCRPFRAVISLLRLPGVSRGATPGYSNGMPSGCTLAERRRSQGPGGCFILEDIGGEMLTRRHCPELSEQIVDSMRTRIFGKQRLSARGWARSFMSGRRQSAPDASGPHSMPWRTLAAAGTCAHTRGKGE